MTVVIGGAAIYSKWHRAHEAELQRQQFVAALAPHLRDASNRVEKIIAVLKSKSDAESTSKTILQRLEENSAEIANRIPDVLVLEKEDTQSLSEPALEYMRGCRSFMEVTSNYLTSGVKKQMMLDQLNQANDRIAALRSETPANWAYSAGNMTSAQVNAYSTADKEIEMLSPIALSALVKAYEAANQMTKAIEEQANILKKLQAIRLQLSKSLPSDALIPDEVLANAVMTAEFIAKSKE